MKILELEYYDKILDWKLNVAKFSDLNLLVGISGVGKTKILIAIINLKGIALGKSINGIKWKMKFSIDDSSEYTWEGETETLENKQVSLRKFLTPQNLFLGKEEEFKSKITNEKLMHSERVIVDRDESTIKFLGQVTLKLSPYESLIKLLSLEEQIQPVYTGFSKIVFRDISKNLIEVPIQEPVTINSADSRYKSLENIKNSNISFLLKLLLVSKHNHYEFKKIKNIFTEVFPQVEDIHIKEEPTLLGTNIVSLYLKEKGIRTLIHQNDISSGMLRTIEHLSDIYLSPENAVILIDEFENSLGVNCIDTITDSILKQKGNIQYIITSHHPYIINHVSKDYWKLVTRKGNTVSVTNAKDLNLSESNHQAFIQLINSDEFTEGIKA